jgi:hypothetical protein
MFISRSLPSNAAICQNTIKETEKPETIIYTNNKKDAGLFTDDASSSDCIASDDLIRADDESERIYKKVVLRD